MQDRIKGIKFFITLNNETIRSLEDLENNFCLQDVISLFEKGVLIRWLKVNGFTKQAQAVAAIPSDLDTCSLGKELVRLFCPDYPESSINDALYYFNFLDAEKASFKLLKDKNEEWMSIISDYHASYTHLLSDICANDTDFTFLSNAAITLVDKYWSLVELECDKFCSKMLASSPCIFFPLLALGKFETTSVQDVEIRKAIDKIVKDSVLKQEHKIAEDSGNGDNNFFKFVSPDGTIRSFQQIVAIRKATAETWDDFVQDKNTKIMVIHIPDKNFVRSLGTREEFRSKDIEAKFPILDGLEYKGVTEEIFVYIELPENIAKRCVQHALHKLKKPLDPCDLENVTIYITK